jgi:hypothetical protein
MKSKKIFLLTTVCVITLIITAIPLTSNEIKDNYEWTGMIRIEGNNETIWHGNITVTDTYVTAKNQNTLENEEHYIENPTVLGALIEASSKAGFSYLIEYYPDWDSLYLKTINNESDGWLSLVDYEPLQLGADNYELNENNKNILWGYLNSYPAHALQIKTNTQVIRKNENVTISISNETDIPVANATIYVDEKVYHSDEMGSATISISETGTHTIFAEKDLHIRSEKINIKVQKSKTKGLDFILELCKETYIWNLLKMMIHNFF